MRGLFFLIMMCAAICTKTFAADDGYALWLNYQPLSGAGAASVRQILNEVHVPDFCYAAAVKEELSLASTAMLSEVPTFVDSQTAKLCFCFTDDETLSDEGFIINFSDSKVNVAARSDVGLLYGMYRLLREIQCGHDLTLLNIHENPVYRLRIINHWDNLDGSIERGYAGSSIWKWNELPTTINSRYKDYARACASIGINAIVLNNVNADSRILRSDYLEKVAALNTVFSGYGIKLYLSANFGAPLKPSPDGDIRKGGIGMLETANPKDMRVINWWKDKIDEIYTLMPDFGGFLVKANSEGMPGPQTYGCSHADGANMFAQLLKPHGGIVMWRTFVYDNSVDPDRVKRSYKEFMPLDGQFDDNVVLQTKNGPLDFQPLEPVHPLIGAMTQTAIMPELQITQEYTGQSTYLVYLLPMWKKFLEFDTHNGSEVADVASLTADASRNNGFSAIAGVSNIGSDKNWTRHHFAQANWYAFGRLAWNPREDSDCITNDWIRCTWNSDDETTAVIKQMMDPTWENFAQSHTPYAMGLTMAVSDHFKADFPARNNNYWKANKNGIGNDRTTTGTDYVSQYFDYNRDLYNDINTCPEELLLTFHFVPWSHQMASGRNMYDELMVQLDRGVDQANANIALWESVKDKVSSTKYRSVLNSLRSELSAAKAFRTSAKDFFSQWSAASAIKTATVGDSISNATTYSISGIRTTSVHDNDIVIIKKGNTARKVVVYNNI